MAKKKIDKWHYMIWILGLIVLGLIVFGIIRALLS